MAATFMAFIWKVQVGMSRNRF